MKTFLAILRWEVRLQARSLRSRLAMIGYVVLCALPPAVIYVLSRHHPFGPTTYLWHLSAVQVFLTLVLAALLSGHRTSANAIPELAFADVEVKPRAGRFVVHGKLRNDGTGEVVCPIFVKAEVGTSKTLVTVGARTETPFTVVTRTRPHTLLLDPDGTCHRLLSPAAAKLGAAAVESVDLLE